MAESGALARGRGLRSVSAGIRSKRAIPTVSVTAQSHSTAACNVSAGEDGDTQDETMALRVMLQERTEQVERLEALVSEKRLIQRYDDVLERRMQQYEAQLAQLALTVRGNTPTPSNKKPLGKERKDPAKDVTNKGSPLSVREILDEVHQMRYEKHRLEGELAKKESELKSLRTELEHAQNLVQVGELPLKTDVAGTNASCNAKPTHTSAVNEEVVTSLRHQLAEVQEKFARTEAKLGMYQKEYRALRQTVREREKELLEWQRKHRDAVGIRPKDTPHLEVQEFLLDQWKDTKNMVSSRHRIFFRGAEWLQILNEKPEAMRTAFLKDASLELCAPWGFISVVEMQAGSELVTIEVEVRRPSQFPDDKVELFLLHCPFAEMQRLVESRDEPKDGWDRVQEQLTEAQRVIAEKESEVMDLQKRLQRAEALLAEQHVQRDADDRWVHAALDETEKTVLVIYKELKDQWEKGEGLQARLQSATESLAARENELAELTVQLQTANAEAQRQEERAAQELEEVRRRAFAELRDVEDKRRQELSEIRRQQQQQIRQAAENLRLVTHSMRLDCGMHDEAALASLDSRGNEILRALLLNEAALAANAIPRTVVSLTRSGNELRAEVQLQVNALAVDNALVAESVRKCQAPTAMLFLQEWLGVKELAKCRNREIQRLTQEVKAMSSKVEEVHERNAHMMSKTEVSLREERDKVCEFEREKAAFVEELDRVGEALGTQDASLPLPERVSRLVTAIAEAEKLKKGHETRWRAEQARVQSLEKKQREMEKDHRHLVEMLQESKQDLENATESLETLQSEHQQLLEEYGSIQKLLNSQQEEMIRLQATRRHQHYFWPKGVDQWTSTRVAESTEDPEEVQHDVMVALRRAYEEYDELYETLESSIQQRRKMEMLEREKLQGREAECNELNQQIAALQKELRKHQEEAIAVESTHERSEAERDELLSRIQKEMQALSRRLAKNDALQRETESAKKALEEQVVWLQQQCEAHESERKKLQEASALVENDRSTMEKKLEELQREMERRSKRAEEMMRQLVSEEDARRALEMELATLRRSNKTRKKISGVSTGDKEEEEHPKKLGAATAPEVKRLREFCMHALKLPLTEKQQTLGDIVAFMEQNCVSTVEEQESLGAALISMSTASKLLRECVAAAEEHKGGLIHRTPASRSSANGSSVGNLSAFGRSLSYSGGIVSAAHPASPPVLASRKSVTPTPLARIASGHQHLRQQTVSKRTQPKDLASTATEVVCLAQVLSGVVAHWRDNEKQSAARRNEMPKKSFVPSKESGQTQHANSKPQQETGRQPDIENEAAVPKPDGNYDFLRRSRAHALCVALSVKDHLDDALTALQSVLEVFREGNYAAKDRFEVDPIHDLRMSEGCVVYALKRISQSADILFSRGERREIEARRGADYFKPPGGLRNVPSPNARNILPSKHLSKEPRRECDGLLPCELNFSPSPSTSPNGKKGDGNCDEGVTVGFRQHMNAEDKQLIQWALIEARRRRQC
ncbi:hypothetical protein C3747_117g111 [Trypanosoma cruzi]|uniref:Flagellar attachment zone protein 1 conserved domain-containing protein n=2 Tax=Trypanosoma cruzi TaxID=5693 RepID=Q4E1S1_TRYCC|nr:hypothetical protein, conserved [Trypanosoma cruzi]EAN98731.1 hypothetical protein, conserved [Trypanosoma cruzi]PWV06236.1 hypothetical protein C3747_117g111 [Trypanosoma cruzi]RNC45536.1 hypothetical protein TcCL_NonESM04682 [Trypanosoma cruzi]|eukprot:XP_820582.1 hypothetical protein [Trypanosoma cruzi strain CL Brener]